MTWLLGGRADVLVFYEWDLLDNYYNELFVSNWFLRTFKFVIIIVDL